MVCKISDYPYSSYHSYLKEDNFVDRYLLLGMLNEDREKAKVLFTRINQNNKISLKVRTKNIKKISVCG